MPSCEDGRFDRCYSPESVPLRELVRVAGRRWSVEGASKPAKDWPGWTVRVGKAGPVTAL
jgi:hypothetical protein